MDPNALAGIALISFLVVTGLVVLGAFAAPSGFFIVVGALMAGLGFFEALSGATWFNSVTAILMFAGGLTIAALGAAARALGQIRKLTENLVLENREREARRFDVR